MCNCHCNKRNRFVRPCRYSLGVPGVGTAEVVYTLRTTLCRLKKAGLFLVYIPVATASTLPPFVMLCCGYRLPIVFSNSAATADASLLVGDRAYLATIIRTATGYALNILNVDALAAAAAGGAGA